MEVQQLPIQIYRLLKSYSQRSLNQGLHDLARNHHMSELLPDKQRPWHRSGAKSSEQHANWQYPGGYLREFGDGETAHGSEGPNFSAAHCRANRLSSAAVCRLSLCLIFSQWVSIVFRLS